MKENPIRWFEIYVQDMPRATAFYEAVLGVTLQKLEGSGMETEMEMFAFPMQEEAPGATGALVRMKGLPSGGNSTVVYFGCEDCAVEAGRVAKAGGKVFKEKFPIGQYGHIALVTDPDGNMVGLHSMK